MSAQELLEDHSHPGSHCSTWPAQVRWKAGKQLLGVETLVVGMGEGASLFVQQCLGLRSADVEWVGMLQLPEANAMDCGSRGFSLDPLDVSSGTCHMFLKGSTLAVLCTYAVPQHAAHGWSAALLGCVQPKVVTAFTGLLAADLCEVRTLLTSAAEQAPECRESTQKLPRLPPGMLLSGAPAALVSQCQLSHIPAFTYVAACGHSILGDAQGVASVLEGALDSLLELPCGKEVVRSGVSEGNQEVGGLPVSSIFM
ncbi:unnamed protein product [Chrysoparadoxa australica]